MTGSSNTRSTLQVGSRSYDYWSFAKLPADKVARLPYSLKILLENLLRFEDGVNVTQDDIEAVLNWDAKAAPSLRNRLHAGARDHAGLHRRALRGGPRRHARSREEARWRSAADQPAEPRRAGHRPFRCRSTTTAASGALAANNEIEFERNGERYALPALGPDGVPQLQGRAAQHRHRPPGEPGIPRPRGVPQRHRRRATAPIPTPWLAPTRTPP